MSVAVMTIDHAARDFSRPYAASSDESDRSETGSDRPAIAMTIVGRFAAPRRQREFRPRHRSPAPPRGSGGIAATLRPLCHAGSWGVGADLRGVFGAMANLVRLTLIFAS